MTEPFRLTTKPLGPPLRAGPLAALSERVRALGDRVTVASVRCGSRGRAALDAILDGTKRTTAISVADLSSIRIEVDPMMPEDLVEFLDGRGRLVQRFRVRR